MVAPQMSPKISGHLSFIARTPLNKVLADTTPTSTSPVLNQQLMQLKDPCSRAGLQNLAIQ